MPDSNRPGRAQPTQKEKEGELQPDPMLHKGRASRLRTWIVVIAAVAIVAVVIYGLAQNSRPRVAGFTPETATQTGKGAANAPLTQRSGANAPLNERSGAGQ